MATASKKRQEFYNKFGNTPEDPLRDELLRSMKNDFESIKPITHKKFWQTCLECFKSSKYRKLLRKSSIQIDKELDLQKFIHRLRLQVTSILGLLTSQ